jgi:hypothetical protein
MRFCTLVEDFTSSRPARRDKESFRRCGVIYGGSGEKANSSEERTALNHFWVLAESLLNLWQNYCLP